MSVWQVTHCIRACTLWPYFSDGMPCNARGLPWASLTSSLAFFASWQPRQVALSSDGGRCCGGLFGGLGIQSREAQEGGDQSA